MAWVPMAGLPSIAACKPYITKRSAKRLMEWCKAGRAWTLEQWKRILCSGESRVICVILSKTICACVEHQFAGLE